MWKSHITTVNWEQWPPPVTHTSHNFCCLCHLIEFLTEQKLTLFKLEHFFPLVRGFNWRLWDSVYKRNLCGFNVCFEKDRQMTLCHSLQTVQDNVNVCCYIILSTNRSPESTNQLRVVLYSRLSGVWRGSLHLFLSWNCGKMIAFLGIHFGKCIRLCFITECSLELK